MKSSNCHEVGLASIVIQDQMETSEETKLLTWQLMTTADVVIVDGGAILKKDGKQLISENLSHPDFDIFNYFV